MKIKTHLSLIIATCIISSSCTREGKGISDAVGGMLPTNYIIVTDTSFSPRNYNVANGNSFTFVNQSGSTKGIYSTDSVVINKQNIANNTSYFFKKDTVGTITFFLAGKTNVRGTITLTP